MDEWEGNILGIELPNWRRGKWQKVPPQGREILREGVKKARATGVEEQISDLGTGIYLPLYRCAIYVGTSATKRVEKYL